MLKINLFLSGLLIICSVGEGRMFANAYIAFQIPDSWTCVPDQNDWICRSIKHKEMKEAVIVLAAKEVGVTDQYQIYKSHLNQPKRIYFGNKALFSKLISPTKENLIKNLKWLDALHYQSEVLNFYTRYLAAIKDGKIAVVVTFSVHREAYAKYSAEFFKIINSLEILIDKSSKIIEPIPLIFGGGSLSDQQLLPISGGDNFLNNHSNRSSKRGKLIGIILILLAAIGFLLFESKRKK